MQALGDVIVEATEHAHIDADASNVTVSISLGAALGVSIVENRLLSDIRAAVEGVNATQRAAISATNIRLRAESVATVEKTVAVGVSAALISGAGNQASVDIATRVVAETSNAVLDATDAVSVIATAANYARAEADGGALGAIAVGAMVADIDLGRGLNIYEVEAGVGEGSTVTAGSLSITASSDDNLLAESVAAGGGVIASRGSSRTLPAILPPESRLGNAVGVQCHQLHDDFGTDQIRRRTGG